MVKLALALLVALTAHVFAGPPAETPAWRVSLDTDPTTYPLHGFSAWLMAKPAGTRHLRFGAGGFGLRFPSFLVPVLDRTGEDGWGLEVRAAMGFASYQLGDRRGLYVGAYAGYLQSLHTRDDMPGNATQDNVDLLACVGYQWFPFRGSWAGVYVQPWAGVIAWAKVGGSATLGTHTFQDPYAIPIAAVHLGYEL
jgi:hypothetical protein